MANDWTCSGVPPGSREWLIVINISRTASLWRTILPNYAYKRIKKAQEQNWELRAWSCNPSPVYDWDDPNQCRAWRAIATFRSELLISVMPAHPLHQDRLEHKEALRSCGTAKAAEPMLKVERWLTETVKKLERIPTDRQWRFLRSEEARAEWLDEENFVMFSAPAKAEPQFAQREIDSFA